MQQVYPGSPRHRICQLQHQLTFISALCSLKPQPLAKVYTGYYSLLGGCARHVCSFSLPPMLFLLESGRGTTIPFQIFGAPGYDAEALTGKHLADLSEFATSRPNNVWSRFTDNIQHCPHRSFAVLLLCRTLGRFVRTFKQWARLCCDPQE